MSNPQPRRLDEPRWPGENRDSRLRAGRKLTGAGVEARAAATVLRRAYGHLSATAYLPGTDELAKVTYNRRSGCYKVLLPDRLPLAERAAWFHDVHPKYRLLEAAHADPEAWQSYAGWHQQATDPDATTRAECVAEIQQLEAAS